MKTVTVIALMLLAGCATRVSVTLPFHGPRIVVPHDVPSNERMKYVGGFCDGWREAIQAYSDDLDHQWSLLDYTARDGSSPYLQGRFHARDEVYALRQDLIARYGRNDAQARLRIEMKNSPNKPPLRMPVSGTPAADAPVAPPPGIAGR
jgi:hypothetical protein